MINKNCLDHTSPGRTILIQEETFAYILPCEPLRSFLSNFTITFPNQSIISDNYTIMPHGSVTLVLFHYHMEVHSFLFGPATKPQKVGDLANKCDVIFIIEFQPAGFYPFTGIDQKELTDEIVPFSMMDHWLDQTMRSIFEAASSADELLLAFETILMRNMRFPYPEELSLAIKTIIQMQGVLTSAEISNHAFYCSRHTE